MKTFFLRIIALWSVAVLASGQENGEPLSNGELREMIASGRFHEVMAEEGKGGQAEDAERRFLIELATDLARLARSEAAGAAKRPQGVRLKSIGATSFAVFERDTDIEEAKAIAASLGARLAEPRSQEHQDWIVGELLFPASKRMQVRVMGWTGIENNAPGQIDTWHYTSDGSPIVFAQWHEGEPNGNDGEAVAAAFNTGDGGDWIDSSPGGGTADFAKCPILEFPSLPRAPQGKRDLARIATAPLIPLAPFPAFDSLQEKAVAAVKERAIIPADSSFAKLIEGYRGALGREEKTATEQGNLELVVAIRNERRVAEAITDLAAVDALLQREAAPAIAGLRANLRTKVEKIRAERTAAIRPLLSTYRDSLEAVERELTVTYRIPDALAIRSLRNDLAEILGQKRESVAAAPMARANTAVAGDGAAAVAAKRQIELDIPDRDWPRTSYDPGKPGKLNGFGKVWPGNKDLDLSRAKGITDFVKVALLDDGWIALRANGTLVSSNNQLNGTTGIWRMIPRCERGALLFRDDGTITHNAGTAIQYGGSFLPARDVAWISQCGGGAIATMKDGRNVLIGGHFTAEERKKIEKEFEGVTHHAAYRYGVFGLKPDGALVAAVLVDKQRLEKEFGVRLPGVKQPDLGRDRIIDIEASRGTPWMLVDNGDIWKTGGNWFPKSPFDVHQLGDQYDKRFGRDIVGLWVGAHVKVTLTSRGRWQVSRDIGHENNAIEIELEKRLRNLSAPIKDLAMVGFWEKDKGKGAGFAVWIE